MRSERHPPPHTLERHIELITPEMVRLRQPLAGIGRRGLAFLTDLSIRWGIPLVLFAMVQALFPRALLIRGWNWTIAALIVLGVFAIQLLYHLLFEAFWRGQTPGKRLFRLRVVEEKGRPATLVSSAVRNLLRFVDLFPLSYGFGVLSVFATNRCQRIGDLAAGTVVVHEEGSTKSLSGAPRLAGAPSWIQARGISLDLPRWLRLRRFLDQADLMESSPRDILGKRLLDDALSSGNQAADPEPSIPDTARAVRELAEHPNLQDREGRLVGRFLREREADWARLETLLTETGKRGLRSIPRDTLEELGDLYRKGAADLAWLRTRLPGSRLERDLNQLVLRAHNIVYQGERSGLPELWRLYRDDIPRTFRKNLGPILVAASLFFAAVFVSFLVSSLRPDIAESLVGRELLDRYVRQEKLWLDDFFNVVPGSVSASLIATNNITVTIMAFALGITLGLGTCYILVLNGVHLGSVFAVCTAYGLGDELGIFILAHGVLEILCVLIAGGAGLVLGNSIISPGNLRRRDALVQRGREAVLLILGTAPALVVAGLVEGYISPSQALPLWLRAAIGIGLAALFLGWLWTGGRSPNDREDAAASTIGAVEA